MSDGSFTLMTGASQLFLALLWLLSLTRMEDVSPWKDLGCERKLNCSMPGQRAATWKRAGEEGPYRCLLLFLRVSSTGTVSCLSPLNLPSLLSFPNLGAEDKLIYTVLEVKSHPLIHQLHCALLIWYLMFVWVGLIRLISSAGCPRMNWPVG